MAAWTPSNQWSPPRGNLQTKVELKRQDLQDGALYHLHAAGPSMPPRAASRRRASRWLQVLDLKKG